jgi:hypothetical protein
MNKVAEIAVVDSVAALNSHEQGMCVSAVVVDSADPIHRTIERAEDTVSSG